MYKIKVTGNYNVIVNDLSLVFAHNRPERMISDEDFERSEDIKKYLGQFLEAEHVDVKVPKKPTSSKKSKEPKETVKTKIEDVDGKDRVVIENKENPKTDDIVRTEEVIKKANDEVKSEDNDIIIADGASSEKNVITEEDKNGVRVDNNGNVVQDVQPEIVKTEEIEKVETVEAIKEEQKEEKPKKKNKGKKDK